MADSKESPEIPEDATPVSPQESAGSGKPASTRDPILEELLRSKSADSTESLGLSGRSRLRSSKPSKRPAKRGKLTSLEKKSKKSKLPLFALIAAGIVLIGGGGTATWFALAPAQSQINPDRNKDKTQKVDTTKEADPAEEADAPWNSPEGVFPIKLSDWEQESGTQGLSPEDRAKVVSTLYGSDLSTSASILPSEAGGFTSDDSKSENADGTLNELYSYWTRESFTADAGEIVQKFINPRFGNWEQYERPGSNPNAIDPAKQFPNTFTNDMLNSGQPVRDWLPIYADWNSNNYGRNDLSATGARWYGEVTDSTSDFTYDDETSQYTVEFKANVKFTAYAHTGEKVSEKGVLSLEFVANPGGEAGPGGKVLVNRSSLTIGG